MPCPLQNATEPKPKPKKRKRKEKKHRSISSAVTDVKTLPLKQP